MLTPGLMLGSVKFGSLGRSNILRQLPVVLLAVISDAQPRVAEPVGYCRHVDTKQGKSA